MFEDFIGFKKKMRALTWRYHYLLGRRPNGPHQIPRWMIYRIASSPFGTSKKSEGTLLTWLSLMSMIIKTFILSKNV